MITKTKIVAVVALTIVLATGLAAAVVLKVQNKKMLEDKLKDVVFLGDIIEKSIEDDMREGNTKHVQVTLENIGRNKEILELRILSPEGTILRSTDPAELGWASQDYMKSSINASSRKPEIINKYINYFTSVSYGTEKTRVSSSYLRSLICAESSVNPRARSHKGASGLSQIMPETGRIAARELYESGIDFEYVDERRLKNLRAEDLYDPAINILIACYLSATYLDQFLGRHDHVVSAWNAGPGAVTAHGNRPPPYEETHQLMARVRGYMTYSTRGAIPAGAPPPGRCPPAASAATQAGTGCPSCRAATTAKKPAAPPSAWWCRKAGRA